FITRNEGIFRSEGGGLSLSISYFFIATYYQTFLILTYHFVYRLKVLTRGRSMFDGWSLTNWIQLCIAINVLYIGAFMFSCWYAFGADDYSRSLDPTLLIKWYDVDTSDPDVGYMIVTYKRPNVDSGEMEWHGRVLIGMAVVASLFLGTGAVILICIALISKSINSADLSTKTKKMQQQLFRALLIQTGVPCVFSYLPLATILLFPLTGIDLGALGTPLIMTTAIFPSVDALFVIFFIPRFRSAIYRAIRLNARENST
ncbi:hypothetical protein PFISCL1PPCAC_13002, partial [Pristionchus fissidentatus]